jgi:uncharacterized membrane protein/predicted DsbA family dithiol-disulfide isomerase
MRSSRSAKTVQEVRGGSFTTPTQLSGGDCLPPGPPTSNLGPAMRILLSIVPALVGLSASAMLAVDYVRIAPVFCTDAGGCEAVKRTPFAALFGVPTPFFGLLGFAAIGVVALIPGRRARAAQVALSAFAALVGVSLFGVQVRLGRFCPYCCMADACGVAALVAAVGRVRRASERAPAALLIAAGACLGVAGLLPFGVGMRATRGVPAVIRREMAATASGQVAVVDFVDFECPFCRMTNATLEPLIAAHRDRIHLVRRQVPLRIHAHAMDAARAACCGAELGQGDAMASALFRADVRELTPEGCEKIAERLGMSLPAYRACVADPKTEARIEEDRGEFKAAGGVALPTLWIGEVQLVGAQPARTLTVTLDRALAHAGG